MWLNSVGKQKEQLALHEAALAELEESGYDTVTSISNQREVSKSGQKKARAYAKSYKLSAPLVPAVIVERIINYIGRINIRKKDVFLQLVCRYWSLKREARRGAPLLKRLHLEPWAVGAAGKIQTEEEMGIKLNVGFLSQFHPEWNLILLKLIFVYLVFAIIEKRSRVRKDVSRACPKTREAKVKTSSDTS